MKVPLILCALLNTMGKYGAVLGFIIPDELPSILSVIYSNIPTLKKGTDSRFGWGFRLGDRADFQVLTELGPQTYTQPLANQGESGANKRNTVTNLANTLYAQRQQEKKQKERKEIKEGLMKPAEEWLQKWSLEMSNNKKEKQDNVLGLKPKPGIAVGEIDAKSVIPADLEDVELEEKKKAGVKAKLLKAGNSSKVSTSLE